MKIAKLLELVSDSCPDYKERIYPPIDLQRLYQIEKENQITFPDTYFELYSNFNEENLCLALGWPFISIERMIYELSTSSISNYAVPHNKDLVKPFDKSNKRILLADNYNGYKMYLDFDPNLEGSYGQIIVLIDGKIFNVSKDLDSLIDIICNEIYEKRAYFDKNEETFVFELRENKPYHLIWYEFSSQFQKLIKFEDIQDLAPNLKDLIFRLNEDYLLPNFTSDDFGKVFKLELLPPLNNNFKIINHFPNLSYLSIEIDANNISLFKNLKIDSLSLNTQLKELNFGRSIFLVKKLTLNNTPHLQKFSFFKNFPYLEVLSIDSSNCFDLSDIKHFVNLKVLIIRSGEWENFEILKELKNLEYVDLTNTNFQNLEFLCKSEKLRYLSIGNCPIKSPDSLNKFVKPIQIDCDASFFIEYSKTNMYIKHSFDSLNGEMSEDDYEIWRNYCDSI